MKLKQFLSLFLGAIITILLLNNCSGINDNSKKIAKLGGQSITENEFNALFKQNYKTAPKKSDDRDRRIKLLNKTIESKLMHLAAKKHGLTKDKELSNRWNSIKKRIIQRLHQEIILEENGGFTDKELKRFYKSNKDEFKDDSNQVLPFDKAKRKVVNKLIIKSANLDSFYLARKKDYQKIEGQDTTLPPLSDNMEKVTRDYVSKHKSSLTSTLHDRLFEKYKVNLITPEPMVEESEIKEYYEKNKSKYLAKETYSVMHMEMDSEEEINDVVSGIKNLDEFKKSAASKSTNAWTKEKEGNIGVIKKSHSLPYGIGMMPKLFPMLDSLAKSEHDFKITPPITNMQTEKWHVFVLLSKEEKKQKPLDRVRATVKKHLIQDKGNALTDDVILAKFSKGKVVREKDVKELRKEIPPRYQSRYNREQLVDYLVLWDIIYEEASSLGLIKLFRVKMALETEEDNYWKKVYQDSVVKDTYGVDTNLIKQQFEKNTAYFVKDPSKDKFQNHMRRDVLTFMSIDPEEFKLEYHIHPDKYLKDSAMIPFEDASYMLFKNIKRHFQQKPKENFVEKLKKEFNLRILDSLYIEESLTDPEKAFKQAQGYHADRKLAEAAKQYKEIRSTFKTDEYKSLQDSVCMGLAQVLIEQEKYNQALTEYRRLLYLYPESPNNYKAQFMIGFIYAENIKNEKKAVAAFKVLLEKYPECDLADDADWMIRNIESGGALMPKLEDS